MLAARLHEFDGIAGIRLDSDVSKPTPRADEVLIRVRAVGVNPVDWKIAEGLGRGLPGLELPHTLGCDVSGEVMEVGTDVDEFAAGDRVVGFISLSRPGAYADFAIARPDEIALLPDSIDFDAAAAMPVAALTSWQALVDTAGLEAGHRVLIHAAAGGVGSIAVQLAKARGATVIGTASGPNESFVRSLGADEFVNYREADFTTAVSDVDIVLDTIGGETQDRSFGVLKQNGFLISIVHPPAPDAARRAGGFAGFIAVHPDGHRLAEIIGLVESGQIRVEIAGKFELKDVLHALELSREGHTRGKLIINP